MLRPFQAVNFAPDGVPDGSDDPLDTATDQAETDPQAETDDASDAQGEQQEKPLTRADLEVFADQLVRRVSQSTKARNEQVTQQVAALKEFVEQSTGQKLDKVAEAKMRARIEEQLDAADSEQVIPQDAEQPDEHPIITMTKGIYEEEGIEIKPNDPEYKDVEAAYNDPKGSVAKYVRAVMGAVEAKRERLETRDNTAEARASGGGGNNPSGIVYDPLKPASDYLDLAEAKNKK